MIFEWFTFGKGMDWINALWGRLWKGRKKLSEALDEVNNEIFSDPLDIARYYIEPDCQSINPADTLKEGYLMVKQPVVKLIDDFFKKDADTPGENQLFVLSDAGMGKTALMTMLKLADLTAFWPRSTRCVLKKLGKNTIDELKEITERRNTILLLDSLDEDAAAYGRVHERVLEILQETRNFEKVIITCRTQFFPKVEGDPLERKNMINIEGFICPVIYLSFFSDSQVRSYLEKRFKQKYFFWSENKKLTEAGAMIRRMGSLKCRPMLLSFVDELMEAPSVCNNETEYDVYDALVKSWLNRERLKKKMDPNDLFHACMILAVVLHTSDSREISEEKLDRLIDRIAAVKPIKQIDIKGRSLINKNSEGDFRFSHYSIQEFCVTRFLFEKERIITPKSKIQVTSLMLKWMLEKNRFPEYSEMIDYTKAKGAKITNKYEMEFVFIPPGRFMMGSNEYDDEKPIHEVTLTKEFFLQTTPVTQSQWKAVMGDNPSYFKNCDDCPVESVSWDDAQAFIQKLNVSEGTSVYRLPTEAEWEYACRAGGDAAYCFGDDENLLAEYAWYTKNSGGKTHPAGRLKPNDLGLFDMHGNVWEWCQDWYGDYPSDAVTDPTGPDTGE